VTPKNNPDISKRLCFALVGDFQQNLNCVTVPTDLFAFAITIHTNMQPPTFKPLSVNKVHTFARDATKFSIASEKCSRESTCKTRKGRTILQLCRTRCNGFYSRFCESISCHSIKMKMVMVIETKIKNLQSYHWKQHFRNQVVRYPPTIGKCLLLAATDRFNSCLQYESWIPSIRGGCKGHQFLPPFLSGSPCPPKSIELGFQYQK